MYFVVEESSWEWDGLDPEAYIERIELFLDRLDAARERDEVFSASTELLRQHVVGDHVLADILWKGCAGVQFSHDISERINTHFGIMTFWDEEQGFVEFEAAVDDEAIISPSAVYVHSLATSGRAIACIPLPGKWKGVHTLNVGNESRPIYFVVDEVTHREFFRTTIASKATDELLEPLAPHAFPDTYFVEDLWRGVRDFRGGYAHVRKDLLTFLARFDDHARWIWTDQSGRISRDEMLEADSSSPQPVTEALVTRRFRALGVEVSTETREVASTARLRRQREREVGGRLVYCEWHYKIERHQNRVHVHEPVIESGGRAVIAIFHEHLDLPGD